MRIIRYISILALLIVLAAYLRGSFSDYQEFGGQIFNTYYKIKIRTPISDKTLPAKIKETLEKVDAQMSAFREDSELSRINRAAKGQKITVSDELAAVLKRSYQINKETSGAFDPAIGPLIDLWGFGPSHQYSRPNSKKLASVLAYSKFGKLRFGSDFHTVSKTDSRTEVNLSAIAKGYAVDLVAAVIEEAGFKDYIVEIGGELKLSGSRDDSGNPWNIGVGVPLKDSRANALTLEITDYSVATSGDYRNFREEDGQTFSHTISPQTGKPLKNELASVTVFAPRCMDADAYATALMAMGAKKGIAFANARKLPALMFVHTASGVFSIKTSAQAQKMFGVADEAN